MSKVRVQDVRIDTPRDAGQVAEMIAQTDAADQIVPEHSQTGPVLQAVDVRQIEDVEVLGPRADHVILDLVRQCPRLVVHPGLCARQPDRCTVDDPEQTHGKMILSTGQHLSPGSV